MNIKNVSITTTVLLALYHFFSDFLSVLIFHGNSVLTLNSGSKLPLFIA